MDKNNSSLIVYINNEQFNYFKHYPCSADSSKESIESKFLKTIFASKHLAYSWNTPIYVFISFIKINKGREIFITGIPDTDAKYRVFEKHG